jgi:hypothetical protein
MRVNTRQFVLSYRHKKAITILMGFLLIVSGMIITTLSVGAGASNRTQPGVTHLQS